MNSKFSKTERANLLIFAGLISGLAVVNLSVIGFHNQLHPPPKLSFGISSAPASSFPIGHFLTIGFFFVVFFTKRRFIPSLIYAALCLLPFITEFAQAYHAVYHYSELLDTHSGLRVLYMIGNPLDYLVTVLLLIVACWLLSIIIRPYVTIESD